MKLSIKPLVAAVAMALASTAAIGQVQQTNPQPANTATGPGVAGSALGGDGALMLTIWSPTSSLAMWLSGYTFSDVTTGTAMEQESGLFLDFGTVAGFDVFAGDTSIFYTVSSGATNGGATANADQILTTRTAAGSVSNGAIGNFINNFGNFQGGAWVSNGNVNPLSAATAADATYLGQPTISLANADLGGDLDMNNGAALGSVAGFYRLRDTGTNAQNSSDVERFGNSLYFGEWLLSATGQLTYTLQSVAVSEVPLPAAVWLLLSGLVGVGAVGRRRQAAA